MIVSISGKNDTVQKPAHSTAFTGHFRKARERLRRNPRVAMMYRTWDRMQKKEKKTVLSQAETYRKDLNLL